MKSLQKVLKISARYAFEKLRKSSPYFSKVIEDEIYITRIFWNHINFLKNRKLTDELSRLALLPLIEDIFEKGVLVEKRKSNNTFYKITLGIDSQKFSVIILRDKNKASKFFLLSCFVD